MLAPRFKKTLLTSLSQFEDQAVAWNQLWENSSAYEAISRAEGIALWMNHFEAEAAGQFLAILIHDDDQLVGGLALSLSNVSGFRSGNLQVNDWVNCGELLVSSAHSEADVIEAIVERLRETKIQLLSLPQINLDLERWQTFIKELERQGSATHISRRQQVGVIEIQDDWEKYFSSLSGNHRSAVRRSEKKIRKQGETELLRIQNPSDEELQKWMNVAFEIEHRSWKARSGTSILATDGMKNYFLEEARLANAAQLLELWFLTLDGTPIAFEYCHNVKGVCLSYKIGYDESHKALGPGRLLRKLQLEHLSNQSDGTHLLDTKGVLCNAKAKWTTRVYETGTVLASVNGAMSKFYVSSYSAASRAKRALQTLRKR